jgi:hypothetical protein
VHNSSHANRRSVLDYSYEEKEAFRIRGELESVTQTKEYEGACDDQRTTIKSD